MKTRAAELVETSTFGFSKPAIHIDRVPEIVIQDAGEWLNIRRYLLPSVIFPGRSVTWDNQYEGKNSS